VSALRLAEAATGAESAQSRAAGTAAVTAANDFRKRRRLEIIGPEPPL
jgi:hypothetical protein